MNNDICPSCGKPNSNKVEICQYCGALLKRSATEPLAPIHTGDVPQKRKTSDLESTLPGWLRDARQASREETEKQATQGSSSSPAGSAQNPKPAEPAKPETPRKKAPSSPLDLLAGLSHVNDEDEETPDWMKGLQDAIPGPAIQTQPDTASQAGSQPEPEVRPEQSQQADSDWDSGVETEPFQFQDNPGPAQSAKDETPDWLNALQAQDDSANATLVGKTPTAALPHQEVLPPMGDLPDWLSALTGGGSSQPEPVSPKPQPAVGDDAPDWLSGLGGDFTSDDSFTLPESGPVMDAQVPDWLNRMDEPQAAAPEEISPSAADLPGWLAGLPASEAASDQPVPELQPLPENSELFDWFGAAQDVAPAQAALPETPAAPLDDIPDWMRDLQSTTPASASSSQTPAESMENIPDWLSGLQDSASAVPAALPEMPSALQTPIEDLPDWMRDLQNPVQSPAAPVAQSEPPVTSDDNIPDWMRDLQSSAPPPEIPAAVATATVADDLPDWMRDLQSSVPVSTSSEISATVPAVPDQDDIPDWMRDLQSSDLVSSLSAAQIETPAAFDAGIPDWMAGLQDAAPLSAASTPPTETPVAAQSPEEDLPDWMRPAPTANAFAAPQPDVTPTEAVPDWLSAAMGEQSAAEKSQVPSPLFLEPLATDQPALANSADDLPAWMTGLTPLDDALSTAAPNLASPDQVESAPAEILPAFGQDASLLSTPVEEQNLDSIFSMDVPDWLSGFKPSAVEKTTAQGSETPPFDASLLPAELPSWVQAMRPMESVMARAGDSQDDQQVENQGPLAGLRSVLPVQTAAPEPYSSKPYALKILADETQLAQAALLDNLLNSESTPQKAFGRTKTLSIRPLRWLIATLLLLAVLVPLILKTQIFPVPSPAADPGPAGAFFSNIDALSSSQPVLVVVDYQPGFAGELELAAAPVIAHLSQKNMHLAFISTSPAGPFLAERLLKTAASTYQAVYQINDQYVNLGYLPGGAGGIKAFAERPASTVGQDTVLGDMWASPALAGATLNGITSLSNFGALIVLTDNPDIGRLWIEQAQPSLDPGFMLMVVSTQAEPMIRPYLFSDQIKGLVAGLEGAAIYENKLGTTGLHGPRASWDAFGAVMLAVELLILFGGVWGLITGLRARRTATEQDEA